MEGLKCWRESWRRLCDSGRTSFPRRKKGCGERARKRSECVCVCERGMSRRRVEGRENVRASGCACNLFFYQSVQATAPTMHQLTCRPEAHKMAVSCLSFDLSFVCVLESFRRGNHRKHLCEQATVKVMLAVSFRMKFFVCELHPTVTHILLLKPLSVPSICHCIYGQWITLERGKRVRSR